MLVQRLERRIQRLLEVAANLRTDAQAATDEAARADSLLGRWSWDHADELALLRRRRQAATGGTGSLTGCRSCGGSTPCTTARSTWTGSRPAGCTRSTRPSPRRAPRSRSWASAMTAAASLGSPCSWRCWRSSSTPTCASGCRSCGGSCRHPSGTTGTHATDAAARDTNFGLPIDKVFGTAYLPRDRRPGGFGIADPVAPAGYVGHLRYPFTRPTVPAAPPSVPV